MDVNENGKKDIAAHRHMKYIAQDTEGERTDLRRGKWLSFPGLDPQ